MRIGSNALRYVFSVLVLGVALARTAQAKPTDKPNVVLVVIDTLRADHLPFYGYERDTAPFMNSLAKKGWVFKNNFSTSSWTAPASASIITSLYPFQHGVVMGRSATRRLQKAKSDTKLNRIPDSVKTAAEVFSAAGYKTFGVVDNGNLRPDAGFAQGFDEYQVFQNEGGENLSKTVDGWAAKMTTGQPYFLYMQFMDPHHPYQQRAPWFDEYYESAANIKGAKSKEKKALAKMISAYDSEIRFVDQALERLYSKLSWDKNTVLMMTSDHGEEFFEHKKLGHGKSMYAEVVRVPLLAYDSRNLGTGKVVEENTSVLDVLPTLVELAGISGIGHHEGKSLVASSSSPVTSSGENAQRALFTHLWKMMPSGDKVEMYSSILGDQRFIYSNKPKVRALFDIGQDPGEKDNLAKRNPASLTDLESRYFAYRENAKEFPKEWADTNLLEEKDEDE